MMSADLGSHPNTPNPYNIPSGPSTSTPTSTSAGPSNDEPRSCSVRGCVLPLAPGAINKMCEACRGRHRIYASTKRARRKMEKAAVAGIRRMGEQLNSLAVGGSGENPGSWTGAATASRVAATWNEVAIDPRLFAESSASSINQPMSYQNSAYPTGSSSALAGALTLPTSTTGASSSTSSPMRPLQPTTERSPSQHSSNSDGDSESESDSEFEDQEEDEVSATLQPGSPGETNGVVEDASQTTLDTDLPRFCSVKGCKLVIPSNYTFKMCPSCRTRYRTYGNTKRAKWKAEREAFDRELAGLRTKEDERRRQAGERSLSESPEDLRAWELSIIDEQVPLPPSVASALAITAHGGLALGTGPGAGYNGVDLNATEGLNPDGTPKLNPDGTPNAKAELYAGGSGVGLAGTRIPILPPSAALPQSVNIDTPHSVSPYPHLKNPVLINPPPLPARMCTVSHCHKILPGFYRYKRCEQHRLQNRYHSKLKRVREKVVKAVGPNGEELEVMDEGDQNERDEKERKPGKNRDKKAKLEGDGELEHDSMGLDQGVKDKDKPRKRNFICSSDDCHNLLGPGVRWRHCEVCRARERVLKRERKELQFEENKEKDEEERSAQKEVERLRDIVRRMAAGEKVDGAILGPEAGPSGSGQEQQHDEGGVNGTGMFIERDPVSDARQGTGVSSEVTTTAGVAASTSTTTPSAAPFDPHTRPSATKESPVTFQSVFRATPTPFMFTPISNAAGSSDRASSTSNPAVSGTGCTQGNTSGSANTPNTFGTGGNPLTFATTDTPLTFRAYKPKTATSAVGRLLAQNPQLSVQVFKDLLLPGKEKEVNTGLVGNSSYHVYKSTPPPTKEPAVFVPTIPTTPPFVYQPTQKKQRSCATSGDARATQNAEARPTKESNPNTSASGVRTDIDAGSSSSSSVANAIASGSGAPHTTSKSSTTPAPASETTPSSIIPRQRASRKPKPTPPPPPPPPPPIPSHYSYTPHSQYPYPYYMPSPYSMPPYGPHPSASSSSTTHPPQPSSTLPPSSSVYSPYAAPPGAYPYPYPYGYPSTHPPPPPPGYPYLPPRYMPSPYGPPPPQPGQPYASQQLQPGTYPPPYGYPKEATFSYYHHPLEVSTVEVSSTKKKRKREGGETPDASKGPPPPSVAGPPVVVEQATAGQPPSSGTLDVSKTTPVAPPVNIDATVDRSAQNGGGDMIVDKPAETRKQAEAVSAAAAQMRPCGNKSCNRTVPADTAGTMCEKCRVRLKKRQAKAKQRFKLEPRKSILNVREGKKEDDDASATIPVTPEAEA